MGLHGKLQHSFDVQNMWVEPQMRESERVLWDRFARSGEAQKGRKAEKESAGEGASKEDSLRQVLAAIGGLSQRVEAMEKEKKGGK